MKIELNIIAKLLNKCFGCPCNFILAEEAVPRYMYEKYGSWCDENCTNLTEDNTICWEMFLKAKLSEVINER